MIAGSSCSAGMWRGSPSWWTVPPWCWECLGLTVNQRWLWEWQQVLRESLLGLRWRCLVSAQDVSEMINIFISVLFYKKTIISHNLDLNTILIGDLFVLVLSGPKWVHTCPLFVSHKRQKFYQNKYERKKKGTLNKTHSENWTSLTLACSAAWAFSFSTL